MTPVGRLDIAAALPPMTRRMLLAAMTSATLYSLSGIQSAAAAPPDV